MDAVRHVCDGVGQGNIDAQGAEIGNDLDDAKEISMRWPNLFSNSSSSWAHRTPQSMLWNGQMEARSWSGNDLASWKSGYNGRSSWLEFDVSEWKMMEQDETATPVS